MTTAGKQRWALARQIVADSPPGRMLLKLLTQYASGIGPVTPPVISVEVA